MRHHRLNASAVNTALGARIASVVAILFPHARREGTHYCIGSLHGEPGQSLKINACGDYCGHWRDFATGEHGDALGLVQKSLQLSFPATLDWAAAWLGGNVQLSCRNIAYKNAQSAAPLNTKKTDTHDDGERQQWARNCWVKAVPIAGTLAEKYLREHRKIDCVLPVSLRFSPRLWYKEGVYLPALVAGVQAADGRIIAVQRIFLDPATANKAAVPDPKKILGTSKGGAVRLSALGETLVIAEGLEDALTVWEATGLPTWACLGTGGLKAVVVPESVRKVLIAADNDSPGRLAAFYTIARLSREGKTARIVLPPEGAKDFNAVKGEHYNG
jgi:hypothetical protein